jgi:uncharacterized spore protein YtfJ
MARPRPFAPLRRALRARDVFGKPIKAGGATVIPVAAVTGGGGGSEGGSTGAAGEKSRSAGGLGFGLRARPIGAYVVRDGKVRWRPAVDVNRLALGAMAAGVLVAGLALRSR